MTWKSLAFMEDAASLTSGVATDITGTDTSAVGTSEEAAREDHVHGFNPTEAFDFNQQSIERAVIHATNTPPDDAAEVEGQVYYDTTDDRLKVWVNEA